MDLSVVIVNWNSADYLKVCLASLYESVQATTFEVIVVDNDSGDGCGEMLRRDYPSVQFIAAQQNLGFAKANNVGYLASGGEYLLFLNPDTRVLGPAIDAMVGWMREHAAAGAAGARLLNGDGTLQASCVQAFPTLLNQFMDSELLRRRFPGWRMWGLSALWEPHRGAVEVDAISGACFLVRRAVYERVGRFTEDYFMYSDDLDLSFKIRQAGYAIVCLTDCAVVHYGGGSSSRRDPSFAAVQSRQAMSQFFARTHGGWYAAAYRAAMGVSAVLRLLAAWGGLAVVSSKAKRDGLRDVAARWKSILRWSLGMRVQASEASCPAA